MSLKTRNVIVNFNPATREMISVSGVKSDLTVEEAQEVCAALNPDDPKLKRCRVGVLTWEE